MSIKIENEVFYSPEQLEFIIQGMRNAFNSWDKSEIVNDVNIRIIVMVVLEK